MDELRIVPDRYYKVLDKEGKTLFTRDKKYQWSLPKEGSPGDWHEESLEEPKLCDRGLHVTWNPRYWVRSTSYETRVFVAEADGVFEETRDISMYKVIARRVRLVREVTGAELAALDKEAEKVEQESHRIRAEENAKRRKRWQEQELYQKEQAAKSFRAAKAASEKVVVASPARMMFETMIAMSDDGDSWRSVNDCRYEALMFCAKWMVFAENDARDILVEYKGGYWIGENGEERIYEEAVKAGNMSACKSFEKSIGRERWWTIDRKSSSRERKLEPAVLGGMIDAIVDGKRVNGRITSFREGYVNVKVGEDEDASHPKPGKVARFTREQVEAFVQSFRDAKNSRRKDLAAKKASLKT